MLKQNIKKCIPKVLLKKREQILSQIRNFKTLAKTYNQYESIVKWSCIDKDNNPIPWYSYPAIEYLSNLDFKDKFVLEYGSGNSSLFWAKRAKGVVSIENNKEWFEKIEKQKLHNQNIYFISTEDAMGGGRKRICNTSKKTKSII